MRKAGRQVLFRGPERAGDRGERRQLIEVSVAAELRIHVGRTATADAWARVEYVARVAGEERQDVRCSDPCWRIVLTDGTFRSDRLVIEYYRRELAAAPAVIKRRKTPRAQQRPQRSLAAESPFIVQGHDVDAGICICRASLARPGRAERNQHGGVVAQPSAEGSQFRKPRRPGKSVVVCLVGNFERENLVFAATCHRREAVDEGLPRRPARGKWRTSEQRPLHTNAVLVVREVCHPCDNGVVIWPSRVGLPVFPTGAANRSKDANIIDAGGAQTLEIPFEPRTVGLVRPRAPEQRGAERIEGSGGICDCAPLHAYGTCARSGAACLD